MNCDRGDDGGDGDPTKVLGSGTVAFGFLEVSYEGYDHFLKFGKEFSVCRLVPGVDIELGSGGGHDNR